MTGTLSTRPAAVRAVVRQIQLARGVTPTFEGPGSFRLTTGGVTAGVHQVSEWLLDLIRRLSVEAVAEDELQARALALAGPAGLFSWVECVRRLDAAGMIERRVMLGEHTVCVLRPVGNGPSVVPDGYDPAGQQRLSRFTVVRADSGVLLAQHPDSHLAVELGHTGASVLSALAGWTGWQHLEDPRRGLPGPAVRSLLEQLTRAAVLEQRSGARAGAVPRSATRPAQHPSAQHPSAQHPSAVDLPAMHLPDGDGPDRDGLDRDPAAGWSWADRWMHARTRNPRLVNGWGGSYPGKGRFPRQPAQRPALGGDRLELPMVDLAAVARRSGTLVEVMERRRSIRTHDAENRITVEQLGELLYRTVRVRSIEETADGSDEIVDRPVPASGALHELEVYPLITACDGVPAGLWRYRPVDHALEHVRDHDEVVDQLAQAAGSAATMTTPPHIVLLITARFGRTMWKYDGIGYALILKDVGVLLQSWYLVATDLGLAPTAAGAGDAGQFATATGLHPLVEGTVGEFVLGPRPAGLESSGLLDPQAEG